ncbi:MAG: PKD domain-containing protein, partial [Chitinophagaceae bacterium]
STAQDPAHFYSGFGHFTPTLYVLGPGGCIDSAKASVSLYNAETYTQISYSPTTACNPATVDFNVVTVPGVPFVFGFGDGTEISSGASSFSHVYGTPSLNSPYLLYTDPISGCNVKIGGGAEIGILGALPLFGQDRRVLCDEGPVVFRDFTVKNEPIISRNWDFGDGGTSTDENPTHTFTTPGLYPVLLTVTTQSNCVSTYRDTILVYRTPDPQITSLDTTCINMIVPFSGNIAVADTLTFWHWDFGNGQTSDLQNSTATFATPGDYTVTLTASNKIGCEDTDTKSVRVKPPPTVSPVENPVTIMAGTSAPLLMTYTGDIISYNWAPNVLLSCASCPEPVASPKLTTEYSVEVNDAYGCRSSGSITVVVLCGKQNVFVPNTFSPNGDGQNEVFYPRGTGLFRVKSMTIFNRWGQVMFDRKNFDANDPSAGWNGTFQGKKASADVYVYMMDIICENNTLVPVKGNITLLR